MRSFVLLSSVVVTVVSVAGVGVGCGQRHLAATGDPQSAYSENRTTVIGTTTSGDEVRGSVAQPQPGDCIDVGDNCVTPVDSGAYCERDGGPADQIVVDGQVVETVCYPPPKDGAPEVVVADQQGNIDVPQNENNTTVTFDPGTDGTPINGDVSIDGNNVAIYGNGADNTIIDGNVTLDGNNVRLRGLTITGDLLLAKNNTAAVLVKVLGNVRVEGENDVFTAGDVFGDLTVTKNNVTLVQNRVQGAFSAVGGNPECTANQAFTDANSDNIVQESELGDDLACTQ